MTKNVTRGTSRRGFLKTSGLAGVAAAVGPWVISSKALSASGEVNVFAWGDYVQPNIIEAFEAATGIKINLSTFGSNEEAQNKLRASGGKGFDIIFPSVDTRPEYDKDNLLQPIDESRLEVGRVVPALWRSSISLGAVGRGTRYLIPFDWGTEGITYDSSAHNIAPGELSYGHLWGDDLDGKVAGRQKSLLITVALYLDATGALPSDRAMDLYKSEADTRRIFDACVEFVKVHKKNIGAFWNTRRLPHSPSS